MPRSLVVPFVLLVELSVSQFQVSSAAVPEGFTPLFNGRDLTGWHGRPHYDPRKLAAMSQAERTETIAGWREETLRHWTVDRDQIV
ncbi:MAG: DUF1080 domain-containing protein, partial [Planctomycetaceae bacterium]